MKVAVISVVKTGRRMQSSDKFMSRPCLCLARGDPRPVDDLDLTFGDNQLAAFKPAFKNGLRVHNPRDLDLGVDAGLDRNARNRRHGAEQIDPNRHLLLDGGNDLNGNSTRGGRLLLHPTAASFGLQTSQGAQLLHFAATTAPKASVAASITSTGPGLLW